MCQAEGVATTEQGLEAVVFTADGDMRQALNNLQARPGRRRLGGRQRSLGKGLRPIARKDQQGGWGDTQHTG